MINHASFNVREPDKVARALAEMLGATAIRAPTPPFPATSWLVCCGDDRGSLIEVMPWGAIRTPVSPSGVGQDAEMRPYSGTHLLVTSQLSVEVVLAAAKQEGWNAEPGTAGLFQFTKVWVENALLIEVMTPEQATAYAATFNAEGLKTLDAKLRRIEKELSQKAN